MIIAKGLMINSIVLVKSLDGYLTHASQEFVFVYSLLSLSIAVIMSKSTNVRFAKQGLDP